MAPSVTCVSCVSHSHPVVFCQFCCRKRRFEVAELGKRRTAGRTRITFDNMWLFRKPLDSMKACSNQVLYRCEPRRFEISHDQCKWRGDCHQGDLEGQNCNTGVKVLPHQPSFGGLQCHRLLSETLQTLGEFVVSRLKRK